MLNERGRARSIAPGEISIATTAPDLRGHNALVTNALFPMAMALAEELAAAGVVLEDSREGTRWKRG